MRRTLVAIIVGALVAGGMSLAVFSAPITRPGLQSLKKTPPLQHRIAPTSLLRNGEHALVLSEEKSCDAACWRLSLVLSRPAG